jgi:hypothetical protein
VPSKHDTPLYGLMDKVFGSVSFIKYLLAQLMVLWNH